MNSINIMIIGTGIIDILPAPKKSTAFDNSGNPKIALAPDIPKAIPLTIDIVAKVTMKEGIFNLVTKIPFAKPQKVAAINAIIKAI
jgi:hypothetical protein